MCHLSFAPPLSDPHLWDEEPCRACRATAGRLWQPEQCLRAAAGVPPQRPAWPLGRPATAGPGGAAGPRGRPGPLGGRFHGRGRRARRRSRGLVRLVGRIGRRGPGHAEAAGSAAAPPPPPLARPPRAPGGRGPPDGWRRRASALHLTRQPAAALPAAAVADAHGPRALWGHRRGAAHLPARLPAAQPGQGARGLPQRPGGTAVRLARGRGLRGRCPTPAAREAEGERRRRPSGTGLCQVRGKRDGVS